MGTFAVSPVQRGKQQCARFADAVKSVAADRSLGLIMSGDTYRRKSQTCDFGSCEAPRCGGLDGVAQVVHDGGLIAYAPEWVPILRGAGEYAGLILNGAKPSDLPIQTSPLLLTLNLKTAKALGITIPLSIYARADVVIE